jgi:DNA-binding transcriptional ArsR family regulator
VTATARTVVRVDNAQLAAVFAALGDPSRVRLLQFLFDEAHCVTQCTEELGLAQSAVSKHLARLVQAGLVTRRRSGRRAYHQVSDPAAVRALLERGASFADGVRS